MKTYKKTLIGFLIVANNPKIFRLAFFEKSSGQVKDIFLINNNLNHHSRYKKSYINYGNKTQKSKSHPLKVRFLSFTRHT